MSNWQSVFKTNLAHQAEIVKSVLKDADIQAIILNQKDSSYLFGMIEVKVEKEDTMKALKIIGDLELA
uniref:putative signal transducing protein n=1 Tax=Roseivirga sp. TaxID=1964215 RepID=UPI004048AC6E